MRSTVARVRERADPLGRRPGPRMKGRLCAPLAFCFRGIFQRKPQDDAAIDRTSFELERVAFAVFVRPGCTDFCPEGFLALLVDVPCQKVWGDGLEGGGLVFGLAGHGMISFGWGWRVTPLRKAEGSRADVISNTGERSELARAGY